MDCGISHGIPFLDNTWELQLISLKRSPFGKVEFSCCLLLNYLKSSRPAIPKWLHTHSHWWYGPPLLAYRSHNIVGLHLMIFLSIIQTFLLVALPLLVSKPFVFKYVGLSKYRVYLYMVVCIVENEFLNHWNHQIFGIAYFQTNPDISWLSPVLSYSKIIDISMTYFHRKPPIFPVSHVFFSRAQSDASSFLKDYQVVISTQETMSVHCSTCDLQDIYRRSVDGWCCCLSMRIHTPCPWVEANRRLSWISTRSNVVQCSVFFIHWLPHLPQHTHQARKPDTKLSVYDLSGRNSYLVNSQAPWQLRELSMLIWSTIKLASWSSFAISGWKAIFAMLCWRAMTVQNIVPTLLCCLPPPSFFKNLLGGSFLEADRVQRGQPVEIAASTAAVSALLDYIYGGQPEVNLEAGLELLRLAEAYDLPKLASAIEAGFRASLDSNSALQILQEAHGLHALKRACEEKVAEEFETCSQHPDFGKLGVIQLARILKREDLVVSREEVVFERHL